MVSRSARLRRALSLPLFGSAGAVARGRQQLIAGEPRGRQRSSAAGCRSSSAAMIPVGVRLFLAVAARLPASALVVAVVASGGCRVAGTARRRGYMRTTRRGVREGLHGMRDFR